MFGLFRPRKASRKTNRHSARHLFFRLAMLRLETRLQPSTYFVATNGLDSNPGTIDQPFASLTHAAALAHAGDTVDVRGGTYSFQATQAIGSSGTATAPIVFQAYPGETAIIDGSKLPMRRLGTWRVLFERTRHVTDSGSKWATRFVAMVLSRNQENRYNRRLSHKMVKMGNLYPILRSLFPP